MKDFSSGYTAAAKSSVRDVYIKLVVGSGSGTVYLNKDLISLTINRNLTDGSFGIGFCEADRLTFSINAAQKIPKKTPISVYVGFSSGSYEHFGRFYCEESTRNGQFIKVTAFDRMNLEREKTVKFTGVPAKGLAALEFPCTMQEMLDYICVYRGFSCDFKCQPFIISEKPKKKNGKYYSVSEILGFIASAHGRNAKFNFDVELEFLPFAKVKASFTTSNVIDLEIEDNEAFTVTGVLFSRDNEVIYIDDKDGSEYDEDEAGVIKCKNPLATVEIAEYAWSQVGGLSYYGGTLEIRGTGIMECGDVIGVKNLKYTADSTEYPLCVTEISYSVGNDGFIEILSSSANIRGTSLSDSDDSEGGDTSESSMVAGNVIAIDHAPTEADLTKGNAIIVQYDPESIAVQGEKGIMYDYVSVFVQFASTVTEVIVKPSEVTVKRGEAATQQFTAEVYGEYNPSQKVIWSISGYKDSNTNISQSGLLTVSEEESASQIVVTATSVCDSTKSDSAVVIIEGDSSNGGYVCSTADDLLFEIYAAAYGTRQYKKTSDGIAYCAYYYTNDSNHWLIPVLISETEDAVKYYSTYNNASQGPSGSFEYNGKTLFYNTVGNYSFGNYVEDKSGLGRHKLSQEYAQGSLEPALELAAIIYG